MNNIQEYLNFAQSLADQSRKLILELWQKTDLNVDLKSDRSPVTMVDREVESLLRDLILKKFPQHGVIGEEFGASNPDSEFQWVLDPIDGTENLVCRIPTFGTLIGLRHNHQAIVGVNDIPAMNVRSWAGRGLGAFSNKGKLQLPKVTNPQHELLVTSTYNTFLRNQHGEYFEKILRVHPNIRIYYDCYAHHLAACGSLGAVIEVDLRIWDVTVAEIVIPEAGGTFKYFNLPHTPSGFYHAIFGKKEFVSVFDSLLAKFE